ncbi:MAG TPA: hypothetical protein VM511_11425, partial [Luteolibacter sp.]|nr:hypothetical protein [Luteolibacter sp.]
DQAGRRGHHFHRSGNPRAFALKIQLAVLRKNPYLQDSRCAGGSSGFRIHASDGNRRPMILPERFIINVQADLLDRLDPFVCHP